MAESPEGPEVPGGVAVEQMLPLVHRVVTRGAIWGINLSGAGFPGPLGPSPGQPASRQLRVCLQDSEETEKAWFSMK